MLYLAVLSILDTRQFKTFNVIPVTFGSNV